MSTAFGPAAAPLSPLSSSASSTPSESHAARAHESNQALLGAANPVLEKNSIRAKINALMNNIESVIVGKRDAIKLALIGLFARGHILIEDVPGVGKTTLARALAKSIDCKFSRIQLTPDLLPGDVLGVSVFNNETHTFEFKPGPIFANVILADEINRTTPRTQSALLEAMAEEQVSVENRTYPLQRPFMVVATQNPFEFEGTYH